MTADMEYMFIAVSAILHNKNGSSRKQEQETRSAKLNKLCSYCFKKLIRRQTWTAPTLPDGEYRSLISNLHRENRLWC